MYLAPHGWLVVRAGRAGAFRPALPPIAAHVELAQNLKSTHKRLPKLYQLVVGWKEKKNLRHSQENSDLERTT